jgi:hypothetical protein
MQYVTANEFRCVVVHAKIIDTHGTISSAILIANLPTLVPPYFWTSHLAEGSIEFWCKFGGVCGGELDRTELDDAEEPEGVELSDSGIAALMQRAHARVICPDVSRAACYFTSR